MAWVENRIYAKFYFILALLGNSHSHTDLQCCRKGGLELRLSTFGISLRNKVQRWFLLDRVDIYLNILHNSYKSNGKDMKIEAFSTIYVFYDALSSAYQF